MRLRLLPRCLKFVQELFIQACFSGAVDVAREMLKAGADVNLHSVGRGALQFSLAVAAHA